MVSDFHCLVQLALEKGRHFDRKHRRRLQEWAEADAPPGSHLRRDPTQTRQGQDEVPQDRQRQQGPRLHRQQGSQTRIHWS